MKICDNRFIPTKKNRRRYELDSQIKAILLEMIQKRENDTSNNDLDLLGLLLQCKEDVNSVYEMTIEDIIEECKLFYFGAQESTSNLLTWTSIVLSMHPNWQEKAREEVLRVCGTRRPEVSDLNRLKIVSGCSCSIISNSQFISRFQFLLVPTDYNDSS